MRRVNLKRVTGVVAIHAERRNQYRAINPDLVHGSHHLVAGDLSRPVEGPDPRAARVVAFVGVNLGIQCWHDFQPSTEPILIRKGNSSQACDAGSRRYVPWLRSSSE